MQKLKYSVGSLFAGVGGICQGFKNVGCEVVWANESDKHACITYALNHPKTKLFNCDVRDLSKKKLSKIDILTAGFPCQPFSNAGKCKGFNDDRGQLFFEIPKILKRFKPRAYFLENVPNLATHDEGKTFETIKQSLKEAGYSCTAFILNSADYTNIPQNRKRLYIVGFSSGLDFRFMFKKNYKFKDRKHFLEGNISEGYYYNGINKIDNILKEKVVKRDKYYQWRRCYVRESKRSICPTLTANMGTGGHNVPIILDGRYVRKLTPRECFNLQGFDSAFKLPDIAKSHLYKQAGNSVVVPMIEVIAKQILEVFEKNTLLKL